MNAILKILDVIIWMMAIAAALIVLGAMIGLVTKIVIWTMEQV
jgi:hypothetical protein